MFRLPFAAGRVFSISMLDTLLYQVSQGAGCRMGGTVPGQVPSLWPALLLAVGSTCPRSPLGGLPFPGCPGLRLGLGLGLSP